MKPELLSDRYSVRRLTKADTDEIFELCKKNTLYYEHCPPFVTEEAVQDDLIILPPGVSAEDKYYLGFFEDGKLIAVMDLIDGYPEKGVAYIGFFMTEVSEQGKGTGSRIMDSACKYLASCRFRSIQLAWVKGNPQAEHFWLKNHFAVIGERKSNAADHVIAAERKLL